MLLLVGHALRIDILIVCGDSAFPFQHLSDLGIHDQPGRVVENEDIGLVTVLGLEPRPFRDEVGRELVGSLRSDEHTSELQSLMRISYAVFCLKKKNTQSTVKRMYRLSTYITTYIQINLYTIT